MAMKEKELADEQATELPGREAMSIIAVGDNVAAPVNEATAVNYYSDGAMAVADADQIVIVDQVDLDPDAPIESSEAPVEQSTDETVLADEDAVRPGARVGQNR
jgi:hypothetical protein